jgi:ribose transport system substrate-binding protein
MKVSQISVHRWRLAAVIAAASLVLAACSSGGTSSSSSGTSSSSSSAAKTVDPAAMAKAQKMIADAESVPKYQGPVDPLDISKVRGKTIYFIAFDLSNAFNAALLTHFKEAAGLMGMKVVALSGQVNAALETTYVNQAVKQKAAGIVLLSVGSEQVPAALRNAAAAHIPVITMAQRSAGYAPGDNITNQSTANTNQIGAYQAAQAFVESNGDVQAQAYGSSALPQDVAQADGQKAMLAELCPVGCTYKSNDIDLGNFQQKVPNDVRAAIVSNPTLNWIFPSWDILGSYVNAGIKAASAQGKVRYSSWNGIQAAMQAVNSGDEAATFGVPLRWWGWATADMIGRYVAGQQVATDGEKLPIRMFTTDMLKGITNLNDESALYQDAFVFDTYRKLWGL